MNLKDALARLVKIGPENICTAELYEIMAALQDNIESLQAEILTKMQLKAIMDWHTTERICKQWKIT